MVQVDLPGAFTIGQCLALLAKKYLKSTPEKYTNKLLGPLNFFLSCAYAPVGMFLLVGWPAWEMMYTTAFPQDPFNRPLAALFYIMFGILMVVCGNIGFILAHHWLYKGRDKLVIAGITVGGILTILPFLLKWGIWMNIGTLDQVKTGQGYSFCDPPFFYGWLGIMSYLMITTVIAAVWFKKKGNQL